MSAPKTEKRGGKRSTSGLGRPKGSPNKVTADARAAIAMFVESNAGRMQAWLDQVAKDSPYRAFTMVRDIIEYHVPKMVRTELTGANGKGITLILEKSDIEL